MEAYIFDGIRTPFGKHGGNLASVRPDDLAAGLIKSLLDRNQVPRSTMDHGVIDDVILGCACQAGEDSRNVARHAVLAAELPVTVPGQTVNRLCASGLAALIDAARAITCNEGQLIIAGGVESMSRAPYVISKTESAYGRDAKLYDSTIGARFPNPLILKTYGSDTMSQTADNVASTLSISRADADKFARASQLKYAKAVVDGFYEGEINPVELYNGLTIISHDEHPRLSSIEKLSALKPLNEGGQVTVGSSTGINDGAVALLIGNKYALPQVKPLAKIISSGATGCDPKVMGLGPVQAITKALDRAGLTLDEVDLIEINEAFAVQVLGCLSQLHVDYEDPRVNPNGGAIAIGHPLGASGARLVLTAARQLQKHGGRFAVVSLCVGMGQGLAIVIERC